MALTSQVLADYRSQIVENCRFISPRGAELVLITAREILGTIKVIVVRAEGGEREALLAETADTVQKALELLHIKSMDAVQNYISANGFDFLPDLKRVSSAEDDDDDDNESVLSHNSVSSTLALSVAESAYESLSDGESIRIANPRRLSRATATSASKSKRHGRSDRADRARVVKAPRSRSHSPADDSDAESNTRRRPSPVRSTPTYVGEPRNSFLPPRAPHGWRSSGPPPLPPLPPPTAPPAPAPSSSSSLQWSPPRSVNSAPPGPPVTGGPPPAAPPPPPFYTLKTASMPAPPAPLSYDVRLKIRWHGHGERRIMGSTRATRRDLHQLALSYVRNYPAAFGPMPSSLDMGTPPAPLPWRPLNVMIKTASFGRDSYDLMTYNNEDLSRLFNMAGPGEIPLFEVEVTDVMPPAPPPCRGMGLPKPAGFGPGSARTSSSVLTELIADD